MNITHRHLSDSTTAVVGGGIAGVNACFQLIEAGMPGANITLVEKGPHIPYNMSTTVRSASCFRDLWGLKLNFEMMRFGIREYIRAQRILGLDFDLNQCGYLWAHQDASAWTAAQELLKQQQSWGANARELSPTGIQRMFPGLVRKENLLGAIWSPGDGYMNVNDYMTRMVDLLKARGVKISTRSEVSEFDVRSKRIRGLELTVRGTAQYLPCDNAVICTGVWTPALCRKLGLEVSIQARIRHTWTGIVEPKNAFAPEVFASMPMIVLASRLDNSSASRDLQPYFHPEGVPTIMGPQKVLMGCVTPMAAIANFQDADQDRVDPAHRPPMGEAFLKILRAADSVVPFVDEMIFLTKINQGAYEETPSHMAYICEVPSCEGLYLNAGHSGHGVMASHAAGRWLAERILNLKKSPWFDSISKYLSWLSHQNGEVPKEPAFI